MWSNAAWSDAPWSTGLGSTPITRTKVGGGAGHGPVKRNEPMHTAMAPLQTSREAKPWTEDDELALKQIRHLQDDDETLLTAIAALVATRRLH